MTEFDRDLLKVKCGAGAAVLQKRQTALAGFRDERKRCSNPFRQEVLAAEIKRLAPELAQLEAAHEQRASVQFHSQ